jgi:hypothetical protein
MLWPLSKLAKRTLQKRQDSLDTFDELLTYHDDRLRLCEGSCASLIGCYIKGHSCLHIHLFRKETDARPAAEFCALIKIPSDHLSISTKLRRVADNPHSDATVQAAVEVMFAVLVDNVQFMEQAYEGQDGIRLPCTKQLRRLDTLACFLTEPANLVESASPRGLAVLLLLEEDCFIIEDRELCAFERSPFSRIVNS